MRFSEIVITVGVPEHWGGKKKFPITSTGYVGGKPQHLGGFHVVTPAPKAAYQAAKNMLASEMAEFGVTKGRVVDAATGQTVTESTTPESRKKGRNCDCNVGWDTTCGHASDCPRFKGRKKNPADHPPHSIVVYTTVYQPWEEGADEPEYETDEGDVVSAEPDEYDIEEAEETRHQDSALSAVSMAAVERAAKIILEHGFVEPSAGPGFSPHLWYTTSDMDEDYRTGERTESSFHLHGWTEEEERAVYDEVMFAMRPRR